MFGFHASVSLIIGSLVCGYCLSSDKELPLALSTFQSILQTHLLK